MCYITGADKIMVDNQLIFNVETVLGPLGGSATLTRVLPKRRIQFVSDGLQGLQTWESSLLERGSDTKTGQQGFSEGRQFYSCLHFILVRLKSEFWFSQLLSLSDFVCRHGQITGHPIINLHHTFKECWSISSVLVTLVNFNNNYILLQAYSNLKTTNLNW